MPLWTLCVLSLSQPLDAGAVHGEVCFGLYACGLIPGDIGLQFLLLIAQVVQLIDKRLLNRTACTLKVGGTALQTALLRRQPLNVALRNANQRVQLGQFAGLHAIHFSDAAVQAQQLRIGGGGVCPLRTGESARP